MMPDLLLLGMESLRFIDSKSPQSPWWAAWSSVRLLSPHVACWHGRKMRSSAKARHHYWQTRGSGSKAVKGGWRQPRIHLPEGKNKLSWKLVLPFSILKTNSLFFFNLSSCLPAAPTATDTRGLKQGEDKLVTVNWLWGHDGVSGPPPRWLQGPWRTVLGSWCHEVMQIGGTTLTLWL